MTPLRVSDEELHDLLVRRLDVISEAGFGKARAMAARFRIPLERALVERGRIPFSFLLEHLAQAWGVGFADVRINEVQSEALRAVPEEYARANLLVPVRREGGDLHVAMWDPRNRRIIDEIERMTRLRVVPLLAPETPIRRAQLLYKGDLRDILERAALDQSRHVGGTGRGADDNGFAIDLLNRILEYAAISRASDIHIEPYELEGVVRCRIDGVLQEILTLAPAALPSLVARVKILAGLRIDERRAPQDGRFEADLGGFKMDLRVSSLPTHWGEKIVMRVLSKESIAVDLEDLGLAASDYPIVLRNILKPFGMILITGPTGSGKTTSLYAMLMRVGTERHNVVNISTIEDPIEYTIPRVSQVPVSTAAGLEFSNGLRALLRQDPDIIMVGEIRDRETAEIAVRAALVGRLLLSTLHTNDSTGAVPRLLDMGIEPFLLASTLALVVAQRLVRRICVNCRQTLEPDPVSLRAIRTRPDFEDTVRVLQQEGVLSQTGDPLSGVRLFHGKGCPQCADTGFRGRLGVFELFEIDDDIRGMIMERQDAVAIRVAARKKGMKTMFQDGLAKVFFGETTLEEVFRVAL